MAATEASRWAIVGANNPGAPKSRTKHALVEKYGSYAIDLGINNEFDTEYVYFNEEEKPKWVTRKKNILASNAKYENVVIFHDYFLFDLEWYNNFLVFGDDWDVCSNKQLLITGNRHFTDWVTWDHPTLPKWSSVDYDDWSQTKYMYQSGGYMLVKKDFLLNIPFEQNRLWGTAEDVEWSLRMRDTANWKCNKLSTVRHNKVHRDAR